MCAQEVVEDSIYCIFTWKPKYSLLSKAFLVDSFHLPHLMDSRFGWVDVTHVSADSDGNRRTAGSGTVGNERQG